MHRIVSCIQIDVRTILSFISLGYFDNNVITLQNRCTPIIDFKPLAKTKYNFYDITFDIMVVHLYSNQQQVVVIVVSLKM